jgi:phage anti-repressor protein
MMAGTPKGREVREYFLDVEEKYLSSVQNAKIAKIIRRDFTDVIQASGLNDTMHGFCL